MQQHPSTWSPSWRTRLVSLVTSTEPGGTCLLAAAPGYGSTTLLRSVAQTSRDCVTFISLRRSADVWAAVGSALGEDSDQPQDVLRALASTGPRWLMLDAPSVGGHAVGHLAEELPSNVRLAIATHRSAIGGPALAGRVMEISEDLLKFRLDEAMELLSELPLDEAEAVWAASDGWLAAMLSALSPLAQTSGDSVRWLNGPGAQRLFLDWFERLSPGMRDFLVATAVLDDLGVEVCNAVTDADDSAVTLATLARDHAFVTQSTTADGLQWRRHRLLTHFLRHRTERTRANAVSHSRAADWYRGCDDVESSMRHLLAAGRTADAAAYLREQEADLFRWGKAAKALDWYQQLPRDAHGTTVQQVLRVAWGYAYSTRLEEAQMWLSRLQSLLHDHPDDGLATPEAAERVDREIRIEGESDVLEAYIAAFNGDVGRMRECSERAIAAFDGGTERDSEQISHLLLVKSLQWSGDLAGARNQLDRLERCGFANDMIRESTLPALSARQLRLEGRIHLAFCVADRARHWIETLGLDPLEMRQVNIASERAAALLERGDVAEAEPLLLAALQAQQDNRRIGDAATTLIELARLRCVSGDAGAGVRDLQQARTLLTRTAPGSALLTSVDAAEARIRISMGDGVRAERLIRGLPRSEERTLLWSRLSLARQGDVRRTLLTLDPSTPRTAAELHLLRGWAMRRRSMRAAEAHLIEAADIAVEHGQGLLLADAGQEVREVAEEAARNHSHDGLLWLLSILAQDSVQPPAVGPALSPGEMRLVTMLPTRDTVAKIASRLNVTENTVKTRMSRLYRKLDVNSRDEAITVARARGLL